MPRQLPWLNKGGGSGKQAKPPPRAVKKKPVASDIDDDFFDGTVLASSSKGKGRAGPNEDASDDGLPDLPTESTTPRAKSKFHNALRNERAQSSSPPPIADLEQPRIEFMYKGFSKFDLRDDEWMMVEDEFLETAKLFTRHLHIAEYERLKERIEEKKKEADVARPVVTNTKLSAEGAMKEKAKLQQKKQRKAIQDVFASQNDEDPEDEVASMRPPSRKATSSPSSSRLAGSHTSKRTSNPYPARDTDSDNLDAPQRPAKLTPAPRPTTTATTIPAPIRRHTPAPSKSALSHAGTNASSSFAKPALPLPTTKPRSRISRATPFDMLDDYTPRKTHTTPTSALDKRHPSASSLSGNRIPSSSPAKPPTTPDEVKNGRTGRSVDLFDDWNSGQKHGSDSMSNEAADRLAKRKAEREKEDMDKEKKKKRRAVRLDDIPTFLF